jgi:hypothetical protein
MKRMKKMTKKTPETTEDGFHLIPFVQAIISPGQTVDMMARPQIPVRGPYYLGIRTEYCEYVYVEKLQFANVTPCSGVGKKEAVPSFFFIKDIKKEWPQG